MEAKGTKRAKVLNETLDWLQNLSHPDKLPFLKRTKEDAIFEGAIDFGREEFVGDDATPQQGDCARLLSHAKPNGVGAFLKKRKQCCGRLRNAWYWQINLWNAVFDRPCANGSNVSDERRTTPALPERASCVLRIGFNFEVVPNHNPCRRAARGSVQCFGSD